MSLLAMRECPDCHDESNPGECYPCDLVQMFNERVTALEAENTKLRSTVKVRGFIVAALLRRIYDAESVRICHYCRGEGIQGGQRCRHCGGSAWVDVCGTCEGEGEVKGCAHMAACPCAYVLCPDCTGPTIEGTDA